MYPLSLIRPTKDHTRESAGFAVANDAAEHEALSDLGYEPKFVAEDGEEAEATPVKKPGRPKKAE